MEFFNIGGGEFLVLLLLALLLFGPEDISNIMRTVGKYTRVAQRMWAQISQDINLEQQLMSEPAIREAYEETRQVLGEIRAPIKETESTLQATTQAIQSDFAPTLGASVTGHAESNTPTESQTEAPVA